MRISTRGEYGVRAMVYMALNYLDGDIPLSRIALEENISQQYLEQIFSPLRQSGLINSKRGAKGGYTLARSPEKIFVGDIIRALEGPIAPVECVSDQKKNEDCRCGKSDNCLARQVWEKLRDHINELLNDISLQDMLDWKH